MTLIEQARSRLGGLLRDTDYPTPDEVRAKFSSETKVMPLPDAGNFRVSMGDEERERVKRQITAAVEASLREAVASSGFDCMKPCSTWRIV